VAPDALRACTPEQYDDEFRVVLLERRLPPLH
jgi:hypothetical protein